MIVGDLPEEEKSGIKVRYIEPTFYQIAHFFCYQNLQQEISSLYAAVSEKYFEDWEEECKKINYTDCPDVVKQVTHVTLNVCTRRINFYFEGRKWLEQIEHS